MPGSKEELLDAIESGTVIACGTAAQCREVLQFLEDEGGVLGKASREWLHSSSNTLDAFPNVGYSIFGCFGRFTDSIFDTRPHLEFEDIAHILRDESPQDYEIDDAAFDALFNA